jgi:hypothetical protein
VQLDYERDASAATCISAQDLATAVEARLGRKVFEKTERADLVARVHAQRTGRRFIVDVELYDGAARRLGQRQLSTRAAHCSALDDSLALVLSLAADMPRELEPLPARHEAPPRDARDGAVTAPPPASLETPLSIPETTYAPRLGWRARPSLGLAVLGGLLPSPALGVEIGVEIEARAFWPLALRGAWWGDQRQGVERGAEFSARTLSVEVCPWQGRVGRFETSACAAQWFGRVDASGFGFDEEQRTERWLAAVGGGIASRYWFGPVFVSAQGSLLVPLVARRYFFTDGAEFTLHEEPWLFGAGSLRVGIDL